MKKKILIIDDDTAVLEMMDDVLTYKGYTVVCSPMSEDIEGLIRYHAVDLIIIDYLLPGINGSELCHQLKDSTEFGHLPVILYSAHPRALESLGSSNCDAFLSKPFDLEDLFFEISECLTGKKKVLGTFGNQRTTQSHGHF